VPVKFTMIHLEFKDPSLGQCWCHNIIRTYRLLSDYCYSLL